MIYLAPLLAIAFFAYVERGAPRRKVYAGIALALGLAAWLMPFPSLADYRFSFDSPVLSAYGTLAFWSGTANAATVFAAVPLLVAVALALRPLTPRAAHVFGIVGVCLLAATGAIAYAGDHAMSERARAAWSAPTADWLDQAGYGEADFLALPGGSPHFAWSLEAWNRDFGRPLWLAGKAPADRSVGRGRRLRLRGRHAARGRRARRGGPPRRERLRRRRSTSRARRSPSRPTGCGSSASRPRRTSRRSRAGSSSTAGRTATSATAPGPGRTRAARTGSSSRCRPASRRGP